MSDMLKIDYTLEPPSLEHIAAVKVASLLWNQHDIKDLISRFSVSLPVTRKIKDEWLKIEDKVKEKVSLLAQPECLKEKLSDFTKPIGEEILKWVRYHGDPYLGIGLPQEFCWTSHGTIDKRKTAELLVKDDNLDISVRYKLSCVYCLEDVVHELWTKMNVDCRRCFEGANHQKLVKFWTFHMKGELDNYIRTVQNSSTAMFTSPYQFAFEFSADDGNTVAAEYFLKKLTPAQKSMSLVRNSNFIAFQILRHSHIGNYYSDFLCFLLSKMNGAQQKQFFEEYSFCVLCLLDWPRQTYFMKTLILMCKFIGSSYLKVLEFILIKVKEGHKYFDYRKLFIDIWQQIPSALKTSDLLALSYVLQMLFQIKDESILRLIFKELTPQDKDTILFLNFSEISICRYLILREDWALLEYFLRECIISANRLIDFKECCKLKHDELKRFARNLKNNVNQRSVRNFLSKIDFLLPKFFCLLDDILCELQETKADEETDTSQAKRLRKTDFC